MSGNNVLVLFSCYNRKDKTLNTIKTLKEQYDNIKFLVVDDKSTDHTVESINKLKNTDIEVITTEGNMYYTASMRFGMNYLLLSNYKFDYLLLVNDDVDFNNDFLNAMVIFSKKNDCITVGATIDSDKELSYGGIKLKSKLIEKYDICGPDYNGECDTFNGNCVLIPYSMFIECGSMDKHYSHSYGDFDYGFKHRRKKHKILMFNKYVGVCNRNSIVGTWKDKTLPIKERLLKKRMPKGAPTKEVFYYSLKNFNIIFAIYVTVKQYITILLKK